MKESRMLAALAVLFFVVAWASSDASAQSFSASVGNDDGKKEETVGKSGSVNDTAPAPSLEQELRRLAGVKTETSLGGSRMENIGRYFLDKYTGEVSIVSFHRNEPVRWRVLRDKVPEDVVEDPRAVNYQMFRIGSGENEIVLMNVHTGTMWEIDVKSFSLNYKNAKLRYVPIIDTY